MKKIIKIIGAVIAVFIFLYIILAVCGMNDAKKEEELAKFNMNNEISFEGDLSELDTSKDWMGAHIIVSGKIDEVNSLSCVLINNDFVIKAYCDDISDDIAEEGIVTIDGVCTYQSPYRIRMRNCQIVDYKKPDVPTVKEDDLTEAAEKDISTEVENVQTQEIAEKDISAEVENVQTQEIAEKDYSTAKPEQNNVKIDPEWYKNSNLFKSEAQDKLELIWYDDKGIDIAINDLNMYHFDSTKYEMSSNGSVVFTCDDNLQFIYHSTENNVELASGEYKGVYFPTDDSQPINITSDNEEFSYVENIVLSYSFDGKTLYDVIVSGFIDQYRIEDKVVLRNNQDVNCVVLYLWYKDKKTGFSSSAVLFFDVVGEQVIPWSVCQGSSIWNDDLDYRIEKIIEEILY